MADGGVTLGTDAGTLYVTGNQVGDVTVTGMGLIANVPTLGMDVLGGTGTITGNLSVTNATLSPGFGAGNAGVLTVTGNVTLTNANYVADINGPATRPRSTAATPASITTS